MRTYNTINKEGRFPQDNDEIRFVTQYSEILMLGVSQDSRLYEGSTGLHMWVL